jgi:hypothetical protein
MALKSGFCGPYDRLASPAVTQSHIGGGISRACYFQAGSCPPATPPSITFVGKHAGGVAHWGWLFLQSRIHSFTSSNRCWGGLICLPTATLCGTATLWSVQRSATGKLYTIKLLETNLHRHTPQAELLT